MFSLFRINYFDLWQVIKPESARWPISHLNSPNQNSQIFQWMVRKENEYSRCWLGRMKVKWINRICDGSQCSLARTHQNSSLTHEIYESKLTFVSIYWSATLAFHRKFVWKIHTAFFFSFPVFVLVCPFSPYLCIFVRLCMFIFQFFLFLVAMAMVF